MGGLSESYGAPLLTVTFGSVWGAPGRVAPNMKSSGFPMRFAAGVIADYPKRRREMVIGMLLEEYNKAEVMEVLHEQAIEEGLGQGREQALRRAVSTLEQSASLETMTGVLRQGCTKRD